MKNIWNWIKGNPNRTMFLIPILLVAGISISHVVSWYDIANPFNWAIYLSIAIEVGAMTALVAATNKIKGGVWFMFGLVTFIQFVGNIFYSYKEIDPTGESFKMWVELTGPIWDLFSDSTDVIAMKRWLAILEGGFLPLISLASLHFFVKYEKPEEKENKGIDLEKISNKVDKALEELDEENEDIIITELPEERDDSKIEKVFEDITEGNVVEHLVSEGEIYDEDNGILDNQIHLVEEDVPESNIILESTDIDYTSTEETEKELNDFTTQDKPKNNTLGEELNKTWLNIIKNRKNNGIDRI